MKPINVEKLQRSLMRKWRKVHDERAQAMRDGVCEWTFEGGKLFSAQCGGGWWRIEDYQKCPSCERPIKRKSEAAR